MPLQKTTSFCFIHLYIKRAQSWSSRDFRIRRTQIGGLWLVVGCGGIYFYDECRFPVSLARWWRGKFPHTVKDHASPRIRGRRFLEIETPKSNPNPWYYHKRYSYLFGLLLSMIRPLWIRFFQCESIHTYRLEKSGRVETTVRDTIRHSFGESSFREWICREYAYFTFCGINRLALLEFTYGVLRYEKLYYENR